MEEEKIIPLAIQTEATILKKLDVETASLIDPVTGVLKKTIEPMALIDPVTGMLIPVRESEEGQYIPVSSGGQVIHARIGLDGRAILATAVNKMEASRLKQIELPSNVVHIKAEVLKSEIVSQLPISMHAGITQAQVSQISVITRPSTPVTQASTSVASAVITWNYNDIK